MLFIMKKIKWIILSKTVTENRSVNTQVQMENIFVGGISYFPFPSRSFCFSPETFESLRKQTKQHFVFRSTTQNDSFEGT